jgi:hypothetical protein
MATTLLLDTATWDLTVDAAGNIAVASEPYSIAQDVASSLRLFLGELWYDSTQGMPYLQNIFGGNPPPIGFVKAKMEAVALTVPGVASATAYLTGPGPHPSGMDRLVTGQVQITMTNGAKAIIASAQQPGTPWYVQAVTPPPPF